MFSTRVSRSGRTRTYFDIFYAFRTYVFVRRTLLNDRNYVLVYLLMRQNRIRFVTVYTIYELPEYVIFIGFPMSFCRPIPTANGEYSGAPIARRFLKGSVRAHVIRRDIIILIVHVDRHCFMPISLFENFFLFTSSDIRCIYA